MQTHDEHFSIISSKDIELICKPLLENTPILVVDYSRVYPDGSRSELSSSIRRMQDAVLASQKPVKHIYTPELISDNQRYVNVDSWLQTLRCDNVDILKNRSRAQKDLYDLGNEFRIVTRCNDCTEMLHFYTGATQLGAENFYLNNLGLLEKFVAYFKVNAQPIIDKSSKHKIIHAWRTTKKICAIDNSDGNVQINMTANHKVLIADMMPKKFYFTTSNGIDSYLTSREIDTMVHIMRGKSNKEIAIILGLSHRTIDKFVASLLSKTFCISRRDLVSFFSNTLFNTIFSS